MSVEDILPVNDYCNDMIQINIDEHVLGSTERAATVDNFVSNSRNVRNRHTLVIARPHMQPKYLYSPEAIVIVWLTLTLLMPCA